MVADREVALSREDEDARVVLARLSRTGFLLCSPSLMNATAGRDLQEALALCPKTSDSRRRYRERRRVERLPTILDDEVACLSARILRLAVESFTYFATGADVTPKDASTIFRSFAFLPSSIGLAE